MRALGVFAQPVLQMRGDGTTGQPRLLTKKALATPLRTQRWAGLVGSAVPARLRGRQKGCRPVLDCLHQVLSRLKVGRVLDLHIHLDVLRQPTHKQLHLLARGEVMGVTEHGVVALHVLLDDRLEQNTGQFSQPSTLH
jgi:hypothetical protein